jgi:hypothetical protein
MFSLKTYASVKIIEEKAFPVKLLTLHFDFCSDKNG